MASALKFPRSAYNPGGAGKRGRNESRCRANLEIKIKNSADQKCKSSCARASSAGASIGAAAAARRPERAPIAALIPRRGPTPRINARARPNLKDTQGIFRGRGEPRGAARAENFDDVSVADDREPGSDLHLAICPGISPKPIAPSPFERP